MSSKETYNKETDGKILSLLKEGSSRKEIAKAVGRSLASLQYRIRKIWKPVKRKRFRSQTDAKILRLRKENFSVARIAQEIGRSPASVSARLYNKLLKNDSSSRTAYDGATDKKLLALSDKGKSAPEIAEIVGHSPASVNYRLRKLRK